MTETKAKAIEIFETFHATGITLSEAKACTVIAIEEILKGDHLIRTPLSFWQKVKVEALDIPF